VRGRKERRNIICERGEREGERANKRERERSIFLSERVNKERERN